MKIILRYGMMPNKGYSNSPGFQTENDVEMGLIITDNQVLIKSLYCDAVNRLFN